uniref:legumain n=1 Tax=Panagrellus redivivus TaxID=6233 RepID=A0A7E4WA78_PANRE
MNVIGFIFLASLLCGYCYAAPWVKDDSWAVLIAGSNGWDNYRHQSDVSHAYHLLTHHGIQPERIITIMYDDIANNENNPYPGKIFNRPNGTDVYAGVKIDYRGNEIDNESVLNVLKGNATGNKGKGTGRVLGSTRKEDVFIYYAGHGDVHVLLLLDGTLTKHELDNALTHMYENNMYNKMVFYLESCNSGSMFEGLDETRRLYAVTAANSMQSSFATFCINDQKLPCLSDEFSATWMFNTETHNILSETIGDQVDVAIENTKQSHVCTFGDASIRNDTVSEYQGNAVVWKYTDFGITDQFHEDVQKSVKSTHQILLDKVEQLLIDRNYSMKDVKDRMSDFYEDRQRLTRLVENIVHAVVGSVTKAYHIIMKKPALTTALECHDAVIKAYHKKCIVSFNLNPYAITMSGIFANLCEVVRDPAAILDVINEKCDTRPRFRGVI